MLPMNARRAASRLRKTIKRELRDMRTKSLSSRLVPRPQDSYATHMPILIGVAAIVKPKSILELGSGLFSTPAFLDRRCFPTLERLISLENVPAWSKQVRDAVGDDARFTLMDVASVPDHLATMDITGFDLIFVDDSGDIATRTRSLRTVLERASPHTTIVMHDFEVRAYRNAAPDDWNPYTFRIWRPLTGVMSRKALPLAELERRLMPKRNASPGSLEAWNELAPSLSA